VSGVTIPDKYDIHSTVGGGLDLGLDDVAISSTIGGGLNVGLDSTLHSESKVDLGLNDIRFKELPVINLLFQVKPVRLHFPVDLKFSLRLLGTELLGVQLCGETMVVAEDYVPHATERCE
jgi:hypothetical protein